MNSKQLYEQIIKLRRMDNVFNEWAEYRKKLTNYIVASTEKGKSLAILGAGGCNDLDLSVLSTHFKKIILIDIDKNSINESIKKYKLEENNSVEIKNIDFVGVKDVDYQGYIDIFIQELTKNHQKPDISVITDKLIKYMDKIYKRIQMHTIELVENSFDYSVTIGVHSQLNNMFEWMWSVFMGSFKVVNEKIAKRVSIENYKIAKKLNDAIVSSTKINAFIGCEKDIVGREMLIEGAYQAIADIENRSKNKQLIIQDKSELVWTFDKKRSLIYDVALFNIKL